jgi:hypothetical protein
MTDTIKVTVVEPPIDVVIIKEGVEGKRGKMGLRGERGLPGERGPQGQSARDVSIVVHPDRVLELTGNNHADWYLCTYSDDLENPEDIVVTLKETTELIDDTPVEALGSVMFFTQRTNNRILFDTLDGVNLKVPDGALPYPHGLDCSVGVIASGVNEWTLFGDLALGEVIVSPEDDAVLTYAYYFQEVVEDDYSAGMVIYLIIDGVDSSESVTWNWEFSDTGGLGTLSGSQVTTFSPNGIFTNWGDDFTFTGSVTRSNGQVLNINFSGTVE